MKTVITDRFQNEFKKLPFQIRKSVLITLTEISEAEAPNHIFQMKELRKKDYFSINIGDSYRIGLKIKSDELVLITVMHREDIYNKFP